jgi:hypothetical protein
MATRYRDTEAKCPYFRSDNGKEIRCEGITDGCSTILRFYSNKDKSIQRNTFCDAKYKNCEVFRMLEDKYDEED